MCGCSVVIMLAYTSMMQYAFLDEVYSQAAPLAVALTKRHRPSRNTQ